MSVSKHDVAAVNSLCPPPPPFLSTVPIFDGQLSAIAAELEGTDPEEIQVQVGSGLGAPDTFPSAAAC